MDTPRAPHTVRLDEVLDYLDLWIGPDYMNLLTAGFPEDTIAAMINDATWRFDSTRLGALMVFSVLMNAHVKDNAPLHF